MGGNDTSGFSIMGGFGCGWWLWQYNISIEVQIVFVWVSHKIK